MELDNWGHFGIERCIADAMKSKALNIHGQLPRQLRVNAMIIRVPFLARKGGRRSQRDHVLNSFCEGPMTSLRDVMLTTSFPQTANRLVLKRL